MEENDQQDDGTMDLFGGFMDAIAVLAVTLERQGVIPVSAYAENLMSFRQGIEPGTMKEVVIDQMLKILAGDQVEALLRRQRFHLVSRTESPAIPPSGELPDPGAQTPGGLE